jgi:N-methylhydantoinase A
MVIAVDIGGTFTDIICVNGDGAVFAKKVLSTPQNYSDGVLRGITAVIAESGVSPANATGVSHATTVLTNAVLEQRGAKTALLTTRGFRDVLELRRVRVPRQYDVGWEKPPPLVRRALRYEVDERISATGEVVVPLDETGVRDIARELRRQDIESVAICFLNSYADPTHERCAASLIREVLPNVPVSVSALVSPDIGEYERTSTAVVNAYTLPLFEKYVDVLHADIRRAGLECPLLFMQSSGDCIGVDAARAKPIELLQSGSAAGVVGARHVARRMGCQRALLFDMGGTSAKATLMEDGDVRRTTEHELGADITIGIQFLPASGYTVLVPSMEVAEVGAGGGSIAWLDRGGALRVGPESAGSVPGPACYGNGGVLPTVTDANAVLGYLPAELAGGEIVLDREAAERCVAENVGKPLALTTYWAAYGIRAVANSAMMRAAKAVSTEKGKELEGAWLIAFGGSGPLHGMDLAIQLSMEGMIVPPLPGLLSATGLVAGEMGRELVAGYVAALSEVDLAEINGRIGGLIAQAQSAAAGPSGSAVDPEISVSLVLRAAGQRSDIELDIDGTELTPAAIRSLESRFMDEHGTTYGHRPIDNDVMLRKLRVRISIPGTSSALRVTSLGQGRTTSRRICIDPDRGASEVPVLTRSALINGGWVPGPAIVEDPDSTTLVPPRCRVKIDDFNNLVVVHEDRDQGGPG